VLDSTRSSRNLWRALWPPKRGSAQVLWHLGKTFLELDENGAGKSDAACSESVPARRPLDPRWQDAVFGKTPPLSASTKSTRSIKRCVRAAESSKPQKSGHQLTTWPNPRPLFSFDNGIRLLGSARLLAQLSLLGSCNLEVGPSTAQGKRIPRVARTCAET